jgi:hypothetical protein
MEPIKYWVLFLQRSYFGYSSAEQSARFDAEYDLNGANKRRFVKRARELDLVNHTSTAGLPGLFLYNKGDVEGTITMAEELSSPDSPMIQYRR